MIQISENLKEAGFIAIKPDSKEPLTIGDWNKNILSWEKANLELEKGRNIAIVGGENNFIIIDDDSGNDTLINEFNSVMQPTYLEQSITGGKHLIYRCDNWKPTKEDNFKKDGLGEFRCFRMYCLIAPSKAKDEKKQIFDVRPYKILEDRPITFIDREDLIKIRNKFKRSSESIGIGERDESRSGIEMSTVCKFILQGLSKEEIYDKMKIYSKWNESSAYRDYSFNKAVEFCNNIKEHSIENDKSLIITNATDLKKLKKPRNYIVENFIYPQDIIMVAGDSNSFKSLFHLYEAICICKGKNIFGIYKTRKQNVLILSLENSPYIDGSRINSVCRGLNIRTPKNLYFISRQNIVDLQNTSFLENLAKFIIEKSISLVYIDTINPAVPDIDDNLVRDVQKVFNILFRFVDKTKIAIKFLHHTGKDKKSYLGSAKWKANSDGLIYCDRHKDRDKNPINVITLSNEKNRWGENENLMVCVKTEKRKNIFYKTWFELIQTAGFGRPIKPRARKQDRALNRIIELLKERPRSYSELLKIILEEGICNEKTFKSARSLGVNSNLICLNERSQYEVVKK